MQNFEFYNPVNIVFGQGQISKLGKLLPSDTKIMLAYGGGSIFKNGVYDQVMAAVKGFDLIEFGGIEPNPRYETLMKAVDIVKNEHIGFILAVGGGSVLDGVKFIAAAACWEKGDPWSFLTNRSQTVTKAIPLGSVITLPATGSEMNGNSVVTRLSTQEKLAFNSDAVLPQFSILDLLPHRRATGVIEQGVIIVRHDQQRHEVFEHRAAPRNEDRFATRSDEQTAHGEPVIVRNLAQSDGDVAAQARLRRQQIIKTAVTTTLGDVESSGEQIPLRVEQERKIHRREFFALRCQGFQDEQALPGVITGFPQTTR